MSIPVLSFWKMVTDNICRRYTTQLQHILRLLGIEAGYEVAFLTDVQACLAQWNTNESIRKWDADNIVSVATLFVSKDSISPISEDKPNNEDTNSDFQHLLCLFFHFVLSLATDGTSETNMPSQVLFTTTPDAITETDGGYYEQLVNALGLIACYPRTVTIQQDLMTNTVSFSVNKNVHRKVDGSTASFQPRSALSLIPSTAYEASDVDMTGSESSTKAHKPNDTNGGLQASRWANAPAEPSQAGAKQASSSKDRKHGCNGALSSKQAGRGGSSKGGRKYVKPQMPAWLVEEPK